MRATEAVAAELGVCVASFENKLLYKPPHWFAKSKSAIKHKESRISYFLRTETPLKTCHSRTDLIRCARDSGACTADRGCKFRTVDYVVLSSTLIHVSRAKICKVSVLR